MAIINKNFGSEGGEDYVYFHLNGGCGYDAFTFKSDSTWLTAQKQREGSAYRILIHANPNILSNQERNGKIIPKYGNFECENSAIMVKQAAGTGCYVGSESSYTYHYSGSEEPIKALPCDTEAGDYVITATCVIKTCDSSCNCPTATTSTTFTVHCDGPNDEEESIPLFSLPYRDNGSTILFMQEAGPCNVDIYMPKISILYNGSETNETFVDNDEIDEFAIEYWGENPIGDKRPIAELISSSTVSWIVADGDPTTTDEGKKRQYFKTTPNPNDSERELKFHSEYDNANSDDVTIKQIGKGKLIIPDFDYLTFVFEWSEMTGGIDLDSATFVNVDSITINSNPLSQYPVGFNCVGSDEGYIPTEKGGRAVVTEVGKYIQHGGDNWTSGDESVLVNFKEIWSKISSSAPSEVTWDLYGNWYEDKADGRCKIIIKAYKGGSMRQSGYLFVPTDGAQQVFEGEITGIVDAYSTTNASDGYDACNDTTEKKNRLYKTSFQQEKPDRSDPGYWYQFYDPRYCGDSCEDYCKRMAAKYGYREK